MEHERIFQQAFTAQDPAPLLLDILKQHPTYLPNVISYFIAVRNDLYRAQTLASALAKIIDSTDAPYFGDGPLSVELYYKLGDAHFILFENDTVYGPKNTLLVDSLLSGFSFKYNLSSSPNMYGYIDLGLDGAWFGRVRDFGGRSLYTTTSASWFWD